MADGAVTASEVRAFNATVEIVPPKGCDASKMLQSVRLLKDAGVDAVNVPDGPRAQSRMGVLATSLLIQLFALAMPLLIDGYNLLHATGILGRGRGHGWLARSREALLNVHEVAHAWFVEQLASPAGRGMRQQLEAHQISVWVDSRNLRGGSKLGQDNPAGGPE